MGWTKAQQKVIDTRNKNLLVSAAAGSGKTAVLVERIISMISEGENPMDIDHLLVVTFTNAAAAEMRGRIGKAIDEKLLKEPDNLHLQKQLSLLQSAQITTIHSFCLFVIRNYFHMIDLDPSFKIAEDSEITLMKSDVMSEVLERWYEEGREEFHAFIESYSYSKSDAPVEDLVLELFHFSMSDPWPKVWLSKKLKAFEVNTLEEMYQSDWMNELLSYIKVIIKDLIIKNENALRICNGPQGPTTYIPALLSDREILDRITAASSYEKYAEIFAEISYARLSSKKEEGVLDCHKDKVKELREEVKKGIKDLTNQYFFQSPEEMLHDLCAVKDVMKVLFELTIDFMDEFARKKEEKNLVDFNDLEHFALRILISEQDNVKVPSQAAIELSEQFDEILIDEYQDSNMVQETILKSISRESSGSYNRFMVGDVKQSIYKFRLAMPELFMEKYKNYHTEDMLSNGECNQTQRIDLDKNFRSRKVVLDYVNRIFEQIMTEPVGGIVYDEAASLKYGELFEETIQEIQDNKIVNNKIVSNKILNSKIVYNKIEDKKTENNEAEDNKTEDNKTEDNKTENNKTEDNTLEDAKINVNRVEESKINERLPSNVEMILVTEEDEDSDSIEEDELNSFTDKSDKEDIVYTKKELEARAIAKRIKELTNQETGLLLFDQKEKKYRLTTYKDIVILLRSMTGWSEIFVNTLMQEGIPAYADTGTGYFQTLEIMTILNMLRVVDNPRQDIPFAGVLYSPMVGLSSTELALIRASKRNVSMYMAVHSYLEDGEDSALKDKLSCFMQLLHMLRVKVNHIPIHELIEEVLNQTGYGYYVSAMPGGERRKANIDMLITRAVRFEKGSYRGLFHFIRYIEKLHKYEVDFGEAATTDEQASTVRIMSIHKSKGLEFPVVITAGMGKQFNTQDVRSNVILHNQYGVGPECIDSFARTKVPTLLKKVIQKKVQIENLGEELRVLYVAMTRAKEKLILSGYIKSKEEIRNKDFSFFEITSAKSYLDWVLPAMQNCISETDQMAIQVIGKKDLLKAELTKQIFLRKDKEELLHVNLEQTYDQNARGEIESRLHFAYPYREVSGLKVKMTVSELKKLGQFIDEEQSDNLFEDKIKVKKKLSTADQEDESVDSATVPEFIRQKQVVLAGADRGTLYHKVLELINLTVVLNKEDLTNELNRMVEENKVKKSEIDKLNLNAIEQFIQSNIAMRMRKAQAIGKLYREKQFVIGIEANNLYQASDSKELILVQGIIDAFFEEDGALVLIDYKSDFIKSGDELRKRYQVQLNYYLKALEQITKMKVKEMLLYSLHLGTEISIDTNMLVTL